MSLTTTETLGFADGVIAFMTNNQAALLTAGLDVAPFVTAAAASSAALPHRNAEPPSPAEIIRPLATQHGSLALAFVAVKSSARPMRSVIPQSSGPFIRMICM